jgi:hypothetical protein
MDVDDTTPAAREAQMTVLRRLGPSGRVQLAAEMCDDARRIAIDGELRRHPELTEAEARIRVLERVWGPKFAEAIARMRAAT